MIRVLTPQKARPPHPPAHSSALPLAVRAISAAMPGTRPLSRRAGRTPTKQPQRRSGFPARRYGASAKGIPVAAIAALLLVAMAGCGQVREDNGSAKADVTKSVKAAFTIAADRICAAHLENVLAWLGQPRAGDRWQQRATRDEGIYLIMGNTIQRLDALGEPHGPTAAAFTGYIKTLKARAALYRLTSMADLHRDKPYAARLQHRVDQIDGAGDHDAHQYGLRICGTGPRDLAKGFEPTGSTRD